MIRQHIVDAQQLAMSWWPTKAFVGANIHLHICPEGAGKQKPCAFCCRTIHACWVNRMSKVEKGSGISAWCQCYQEHSMCSSKLTHAQG
jgi:hypothetical protein